jgi:hypothetical protein
MRFTSEPAYSTLTGPEPVAAAAADGDAEAAAEADAGVLEDELLDELHAVTDNPRNAMPRTATPRLPDDRNVSMARP